MHIYRYIYLFPCILKRFLFLYIKDLTQISLNKSEISRCRRLNSQCQNPMFSFPADFAWIRLKNRVSLVVLFTLNGEDRNGAMGPSFINIQ